MKKYILLSLILFSTLFLQAQTAIQPIGTGSSTDPYQIDTLPNLYWLSITDSIWGDSLCFIQTSDIDASDTRNWNISGADTLGFSPIGNVTYPFKCRYYGKGHTISGLYINRPNSDRIGFLGLTNNITIDSLGLIDIDITGRDYTGGLIGYADGHINNGDTISYCYITGEVHGYKYVGGITARNFRNNFKCCYSNGIIKGKDVVGGLIGYNLFGSLKNCYNDSHVARCYNVIQCCGSYGLGGLIGNNGGDVDSCWNSGLVDNINCSYEITGGLIGENRHGNITNCYNEGSVNANKLRGGLIGNNGGDILNCYNIGNLGYSNDTNSITADFNISGGLIGGNGGDIINCYSVSNVKGTYNIGGLIGRSSSCIIRQCYSIGYVYGISEVGGLIGYDNSNVLENSYSCADVIGSSSVGGLIGRASNDIKCCFCTGLVIGDTMVGGLVGDNDADISNSYSTSDVSGGGLVGENSWSDLYNCYSIGKAESLLASTYGTCYSLYWDKQTSGFTTSAYGQGRNTSQMLQVFNFPTYNFDTIWTIREDTTYPALQNVNNAPFAFADNMVVNSTINLGTVLLANDYDYETLQTLLVYKIISSTANYSTINGDLFSFNITSNIGDCDTVIYRVGELLPIGDTLWGNRSKAIFHNTINTSIDENNAQNISIYPNPCINEFVVEGFEGKAKIEVYNLSGAKLISKQMFSDEKINIINLSEGIYIVKIITKDGMQYTRKLVVGL